MDEELALKMQKIIDLLKEISGKFDRWQRMDKRYHKKTLKKLD